MNRLRVPAVPVHAYQSTLAGKRITYRPSHHTASGRRETNSRMTGGTDKPRKLVIAARPMPSLMVLA